MSSSVDIETDRLVFDKLIAPLEPMLELYPELIARQAFFVICEGNNLRYRVLAQIPVCLGSTTGVVSLEQIILLTAWRWQVELIFRAWKQTLVAFQAINLSQRGLQIQFQMLLVAWLLWVAFQHQCVLHDGAIGVDQARQVVVRVIGVCFDRTVIEADLPAAIEIIVDMASDVASGIGRLDDADGCVLIARCAAIVGSGQVGCWRHTRCRSRPSRRDWLDCWGQWDSSPGRPGADVAPPRSGG